MLSLIQADKAALKQRHRARKRRKTREGERMRVPVMPRSRKIVQALLNRGQISRAVRRIYPHGLANANDPLIKAALQAKYPDKGRDLPLHVYKGQCVDKMETLGLDIGVASGFRGLRNEHLQCLGEVWNYNKFRVLETFCFRYVNGNLTPWFCVSIF